MRHITDFLRSLRNVGNTAMVNLVHYAEPIKHAAIGRPARFGLLNYGYEKLNPECVS